MREVFHEPVTGPNGIAYERVAILAHVARRCCDPFDPTRALVAAELTPAIALREIAEVH